MPLWLSLLLGAIQGLTEFLPVSSSGHLALLQNLFGIEQYITSSVAFDAMLHLGTLVAVFIAFRKDIADLCKGAVGLCLDGFRTRQMPSRRMLLMLLLATAPLAAAALLQDKIEALFQSPLAVGFALLGTAAILCAADGFSGRKTAKTASYASALVVGLSQLVATIPGLSRSGVTISAGLFQGYERAYAMRFSFLLSIPAVLGASVLSLPELFADAAWAQDWPVFLAGFAASAVFGYIAIGLVRLLIKKNNFRYFAYYCAVVGLVSIVVCLLNPTR